MINIFSAKGMYYDVTGATNATPIVVTLDSPGSTAHTIANGTVVVIEGITGNTAANGSWLATSATATEITLTDNQGVSSVGNGAYGAGGTIKPNGLGLPIKATQILNSADASMKIGQFTEGSVWSPGRLRIYTNVDPVVTTEQMSIKLYGRHGGAFPWINIVDISHTDTFIDASTDGGGTGFYFEVALTATNLFPEYRWKMIGQTDALSDTVTVNNIVILRP